MKLVDILARDMMSWPEGFDVIHGYMWNAFSGRVYEGREWINEKVTRAEWQAVADGLIAKNIDSGCLECTARDKPIFEDGHRSGSLVVRNGVWVEESWSGEGLPPAGIDAEVLFDSLPLKYVGCKVLAHDEGRAVYRFTTGPRKGEYGSDLTHFTSGSRIAMFRPVRTPEQIAAEQKGRAVTDMLCIVTSSALKGRGVSAQLEALYDAGYSKQEAK